MPDVNIIFIGFILLVIAIIIIIAGSLLQGKGDVKVGVGGFIGPFAFGWANDPQMLKIILVVTAIVAIVFLIFTLKIL